MSTAAPQALDRRAERLRSWFTPARISVAVIAVFVVLSASIASKPFHLDSMDFAAAAAQTSSSGIPLYYRGEQNPQFWGLYHPPLYIYMLAAWVRIFGSAEAQIRMFGMICALIQGVVVLDILRTLWGRRRVDPYQQWFWLVFLLNPYTLQTAGIADIDSTIYGPLLCLVLLTTLRMSWRDGTWKETPSTRIDYFLLGGAIFLCLWAKLTTILLVLPFVFLLLIHKFGSRRAAVVTVGLSSASIAAFLLTFWIYGRITGLGAGFTFAFAWISYVQRGTSGGPSSWSHLVRYTDTTWLDFVKRATSGAPSLLSSLQDYAGNFRIMAPMLVAWTGLLPWVAAAAAIAITGAAAIRCHSRRAAHYCILVGVALLTTLYYCAKTITFGFAPFKYTFVFWGLSLTAPLFLTFCEPANDTGRALPRTWAGALTLLFVAGLGLGAFRVHDYLILFGIQRYVWLLVLSAAAFLIGALLRHALVARAVAAGSLLFYCGFQFGVALHQSRVDYATTYDYGQTGFLDTVAFIRLNTAPDDVIASMKDIGYRSGRRYFETYRALYGDDAEAHTLENQIASGKIKYEIFTEERGQDQLVVNPPIRAWINEHCRLVRSLGNYRIYQYSGP